MWTRVGLTMIVIVGMLCGTCAYVSELESRSPIVETCFKHPAMRGARIHHD